MVTAPSCNVGMQLGVVKNESDKKSDGASDIFSANQNARRRQEWAQY
jgi:hypothetical protein